MTACQTGRLGMFSGQVASPGDNSHHISLFRRDDSAMPSALQRVQRQELNQ